MSGKVVGWAFEAGGALSPTQRYVLVAYADNASEKHGKCWPDKSEIVEKTGLSRATVYRAIRDLEGAGCLRFTEDEKGRECVLLAVPWASHSETDSSQGENEGSDRPSQPETSQSHSETEPSHSETASNKGTVKNRQEPSRGTESEEAPPPRRAISTESQLSDLLADLVQANDPDGVRPRVTQKWLDAERLLITRDGRDPEVAARLIRWCQGDDFWRGNVKSMPKFRQKYATLFDHARRAGKPTGPASNGKATTDRSDYERMEAAT